MRVKLGVDVCFIGLVVFWYFVLVCWSCVGVVFGRFFDFREAEKIFFKKCVRNTHYTTTTHTSHITHRTAHIAHHASHITHHTSHITHYTTTKHTSRITQNGLHNPYVTIRKTTHTIV